MLKSRGAVPVLAHPGEYGWTRPQVLQKLDAWQQAGLMGLEVYHPANRGHYAEWDHLARSWGLLVTGGSDFHGEGANHAAIGAMIPEWSTALQDAWKLFRAANHQ